MKKKLQQVMQLDSVGMTFETIASDSDFIPCYISEFAPYFRYLFGTFILKQCLEANQAGKEDAKKCFKHPKLGLKKHLVLSTVFNGKMSK